MRVHSISRLVGLPIRTTSSAKRSSHWRIAMEGPRPSEGPERPYPLRRTASRFERFHRCHGGRSGGGDSSGGSAGGGSRDRGSRGVRRSHAATRTAATPAAANPRTRRAVAHGNSPPVGGGGGVTATTCIENVFTLSCVYVSAGVTLPTTTRNV